MIRALYIGAALAVLAIGVLVVAVWGGVLNLDLRPTIPDRALVICLAPDAASGEVAEMAFSISRGTQQVVLRDTTAKTTVPGTTADSAREAYPYVGGEGVADLLRVPSDASLLPWIVLPASAWTSLVDANGGAEVDVPQRLSIYRDGSLVVLEAGRQRLAGSQALAALSATDFIEDPTVRNAFRTQLMTAVAESIAASDDSIPRLVSTRRAKSSLSVGVLKSFVDAP